MIMKHIPCLTRGGALALIAAAGLASASGARAEDAKGEQLAKGSDCFSCHAVDTKVVGPAFKDVAAKFGSDPKAVDTLSDAVMKGHVGTWGSIPMPAHPQLSASDTKEIIQWILSLKGGKSASAAPADAAGKTADASGAGGSGKSYTYTVNGKKVTSDVEIFQPGSSSKVTKAVFHGYEQYNAYCFRCHGEDAMGGEYAPNLRHSLSNGMTEDQFTNVAMVGRKDKGMPSWAGFFNPTEIHEIYAYVKARSLDAIGTGAPEE